MSYVIRVVAGMMNLNRKSTGRSRSQGGYDHKTGNCDKI